MSSFNKGDRLWLDTQDGCLGGVQYLFGGKAMVEVSFVRYAHISQEFATVIFGEDTYQSVIFGEATYLSVFSSSLSRKEGHDPLVAAAKAAQQELQRRELDARVAELFHKRKELVMNWEGPVTVRELPELDGLEFEPDEGNPAFTLPTPCKFSKEIASINVDAEKWVGTCMVGHHLLITEEEK